MKTSIIANVCAVGLLLASFMTISAQFPNIKIPKPVPASTPSPAQSDEARPSTPPSSTVAAAATEPTIRKNGVIVAAQTYSQYYANPSATQYDSETWTWLPTVVLQINGPISSGSVINVEYTKPDGKSWLNYDCETQETRADRVYRAACGNNLGAQRAILQTGLFGIKITVKNELQGTNSSLFNGKFKVEKYVYNPANNPKFSKNSVYWVNDDWRLPIGYVFAADRVNPKDGTPYAADASQLVAQMWFRGKSADIYNIEAHLFYQGREVANTASEGGGIIIPETIYPTRDSNSDKQYVLESFNFGALVFDHNTNERIQNRGFPMYKNPGEYEIKVLQNGHLARSAKFTMGGDGSIVDNGVAGANKVGVASRVLIPVQIVGTQDGADVNAWKTDAFYGNLLTGFSIP